MSINFFGAAYCVTEFLPLLEASAPASIVNVASVAGRLAVGTPSYTASKFALVGWSESLSYGFAERGVYVSLVEPGFVPTEGFPQSDLVNDRFAKHILGTTEQVSAAIRDAIDHRKVQRTVPRWYYALQVPRLLAPGVFRAGVKKLYGGRGRSRAPSR